MSNTMLETAIDYTLKGWSVIPVNPVSRAPLITGWADMPPVPRDKIHGWFRQWPTAGIGIVTGPASGLWVVDIDSKNGKDGLAALNTRLETQPSLDHEQDRIARTPTGGYHVDFKYPEVGDIRNAVGVLDGVDIRGRGGYVVAPPTVRQIDGAQRAYQWLSPASVEPRDVQPWAKELLTLTSQRPSQGVAFDLQKVVAGLEDGERDLHLYKFAWSLKGRQVPYDLAVAFMRAAASRCNPPFDEAVAVDKVDRVYHSAGAVRHG